MSEYGPAKTYHNSQLTAILEKRYMICNYLKYRYSKIVDEFTSNQRVSTTKGKEMFKKFLMNEVPQLESTLKIAKVIKNLNSQLTIWHLMI